MASSTSTCNTCNCKFPLLLFVLIFVFGSKSCYGQRTFGFDFHHRFSDQITQVFPIDHLPEKGSFDYYRALAHRDRFIHGRRLANSSNDDEILTFADGNMTYLMSSLGFLHYASVSLGTPTVSYFVALDTGSDLFWVPCDCTSCTRSLRTRTGVVNLNIYSPDASSTSKKVPCNSSLCVQTEECRIINQNTCPYTVMYLSAATSTSGYLVEDVLHLMTDYSQPQTVDANITFGCGVIETGSFLDGAAPNGLFGLGMDKVSVPSILSSADLTANSFSMCFGSDGIGRINFGDKGSPDQAETSFNINQSHPRYNISVTQIAVGTKLMNINFTAIFDTGTSFTYLNDPAYTHLSKSFNAEVRDKRHPSDPDNPFEYCYEPRLTSSNLTIPGLNLTMGGGAQFPVYDPIVVFSSNGNMISYYCLGVVKSNDVNIIGQNFMTGYLIVFDREKSVLGWTGSDCYAANSFGTKTQPKPTTAPPPKIPHSSTAMPPATAADPPESAKKSGNGSSASVQWSPNLNLCNFCSLILFLVFFVIL